ncbi:MAG: DMT family transporter [Actinomycetota bacterium]|nr:DMT family transporter [Actinomycetota bacterium]
MSLIVAIPFGVASAIAYGASTAVQHAAAHTGTGEADPRGLLRLLRDPRWLMSIGGDTLGFGLQVVALSNGPVVLIQPLLVLTLPVSLFFGSMLTGTRPRRGDFLACLAILGGLTLFFLLLGTPRSARLPTARSLVATVLIAVLGGGALCALVRGRSAVLRAGVYGGVAGAWFGAVGALVNSIAVQFGDHGAEGLLDFSEGLVPLIGLAVLGTLGMMLTQVSFQVGALAASFPANKAADPFAAVVLGAVLLHEHVPNGIGHIAGYIVCLAAIVAGAVRLSTTSPGLSEQARRAKPARTP